MYDLTVKLRFLLNLNEVSYYMEVANFIRLKKFSDPDYSLPFYHILQYKLLTYELIFEFRIID